jgi:hypothetical protein
MNERDIISHILSESVGIYNKQNTRANQTTSEKMSAQEFSDRVNAYQKAQAAIREAKDTRSKTYRRLMEETLTDAGIEPTTHNKYRLDLLAREQRILPHQFKILLSQLDRNDPGLLDKIYKLSQTHVITDPFDIELVEEGENLEPIWKEFDIELD